MFDLLFQIFSLPLLLSFVFLLVKYVRDVLKLLEHLSHRIKKNMHLLPLLSLRTHQIKKMLVLPLLQCFLYKANTRAASVPCSFLPSNTMYSFINSLNSSYVTKTKPLYFKTTKSLVPMSLAAFITSVCIKSSVSGTFSNGAVSYSIDISQFLAALVQYSISNSKQITELDSSKSNDIYLSSLGKVSSFLAIKYFPKFLSILVSH